MKTIWPGAIRLRSPIPAICRWARSWLNSPKPCRMTRSWPNGAGNYAGWGAPFLGKFRHYGTQLAPTSGSMGYGLPAAVGAKRAFPERMVISVAGDGCFMMHGQEFATAVQYDLPIIVLIVDNGMYGTIRMHQERDYPGRVSATMLKNPDFRGLCPRLRRLRRKGRAHGRVRPRPEGSHGQRQAGDHPPPDRPRNHHPPPPRSRPSARRRCRKRP